MYSELMTNPWRGTTDGSEGDWLHAPATVKVGAISTRAQGPIVILGDWEAYYGLLQTTTCRKGAKAV